MVPAKLLFQKVRRYNQDDPGNTGQQKDPLRKSHGLFRVQKAMIASLARTMIGS
jgi:hypothetical protein